MYESRMRCTIFPGWIQTFYTILCNILLVQQHGRILYELVICIPKTCIYHIDFFFKSFQKNYVNHNERERESNEIQLMHRLHVIDHLHNVNAL